MKAMRNILTAAMMAVLALSTAVSCKKESLQTAYNNQETKIDSYITSLTSKDPAPRVVHNNGAHRVVLTEGEGEELSANGNVAFYYAGYIFQSSISSGNLFTTNHEETATAAKWNIKGGSFDIKTVNLAKDEMLTGLRNGLVGVKAGEVCYILFSGKYAFGNKKVGTVPANSAVAFQIWVESISND